MAVKKGGSSKGRSSALARLKRRGQAAVYSNTNWKCRVTVILCSQDDMAGVIDSDMDMSGCEGKVSPYGLAGMSITQKMDSKSGEAYLMWVDTERDGLLASLSHEAVHIAGLALSDCDVDVNLAKVSSSECVAYFVEDLVGFAVSMLRKLGKVIVVNTKEEAK